MEGRIIKSVFFSLLWCSIIFSSQAASPVCNTLPPGLYDYGQTCSSSSQCVTGFCSNSRCACASGTTYITCVAACVSNCNSTITAASGTITNPGYPSSYSGQCFWTIQGSTGSIIAFNVTYLDMESVNSCSSNYLELFDGPSSSYRTFGKMCTSWQVLTVSTTSNMYVVFSTSASGRFHATFKIQGTSTTLQDASGFIVSPGFPLVYLDNKVYDWTIVGRSGTFINLNIDTFKLEGTFPECKYDYLQVYDGSSASSPAYPKYCGKSAPGMIVSTSNYMHIVFRTDDSSVYKGFNATYYTQGTVATLYESGKVASPGYPLNYLNRQDITWTLTTRAGTYLILNISFVEAEGCRRDYITVYDGSNTSARTFDTICVKNISSVIASSTNYLIVRFRTDYSVTHKGFYGEFYSQANTNTIYGSKGLVISPGFPLGYLNDSYITWTINSETGTFIVLNITSFDLGPVSSTCNNDYLQLFDGSSLSSNKLAQLCGNVVPGLIASTSNYMYIVFRTDSYNTYRGFNASYYTQSRTNNLTGSQGFIISPGFPLGYPNNQYITWRIDSVSGTFIILNIRLSDFGPLTTNCSNDYLQVFDGFSSSSRQLATLCGNVVPGLITSTSNYMYIVFKTDSYNNYRGFNASYFTYTTTNIISGSQGLIISPGFPIGYLNSSHITWTLNGSNGTFIVLNITSFDLGPVTSTCSNDYLQVFDGSSSSPRQLATLCGNVVPGLIASTSNYMYIVFRTDSYNTYRGFNAFYYTYTTSNIMSGSQGFIISPGFPIGYLDNTQITWRIDGVDGTFIVLNITLFDLGPVTSNCSSDYLQVFDGSSSSPRQLVTFCGNVVPGLIASTSNYMYIVFKTDSYHTYKGFNASYYTQSTASTLTAPTGYIISPGFPRYFLYNQIYTWTILGNSGTFVVLNITQLNVSSYTSSCSNHHIEVYDGQSTSGVSLGRYCYSSSPVYVVSSSNYMHVVFRTDSSTAYQGFLSNYYTQACLNIVKGTKGVITSSGYPNGYNKNSTCSWRIEGDAGTKISLNITDFEVLPCGSAFVVAYDGQYTRNNLNLPSCGQVPVFSINASSNFVFIALLTSRLIDPVSYRGFKLNYVITDLSYGKSCSLVDQCRSYLTCANGSCSCPNDTYHNNSTLSCHNDELNVGLVAGASVGALVFLVIIVVVIVVIIRRKQTRPKTQMEVGGVAMTASVCTDGPVASTSRARNNYVYTPNPKVSEEHVYEEVRPLSINKPPTQGELCANLDAEENVYANQYSIYDNASFVQEMMK